jgi:hypothetical protein
MGRCPFCHGIGVWPGSEIEPSETCGYCAGSGRESLWKWIRRHTYTPLWNHVLFRVYYRVTARCPYCQGSGVEPFRPDQGMWEKSPVCHACHGRRWFWRWNCPRPIQVTRCPACDSERIMPSVTRTYARCDRCGFEASPQEFERPLTLFGFPVVEEKDHD